jgi:hypothetical protein
MRFIFYFFRLTFHNKTNKRLITGRSEKSILRPKETENKKIEENITDNSQESIQEFYANVASNIADNLNCYLDGGLESLNNYKYQLYWKQHLHKILV